MGWIDKKWTQEIGEVTETTEYHNATVNIADPSLITNVWNIETNTEVTTGNAVIARGIHARINWPLRAVADPGTITADPSVIRAGRMSISWAEYSGPLRTGNVVVVTDGGDDPDLSRYLFRIDEAINGSAMASRVMKISVNGESTSANPVTAAYL